MRFSRVSHAYPMRQTDRTMYNRRSGTCSVQSISLPFCIPSSPSVSDSSQSKSVPRSKMSYKGNSHKPPRKDCAYSEQEMDQLRPFKAEYEKASQAERVILMKTRILPTIFNYWTAQGKRPTAQAGPVKAQVNENALSRN